MRKRRGSQAQTGIFYSTKTKDKTGQKDQIQKVLTDDTKRIFEEIANMHIYGIGEEKWCEIRNEIKKINTDSAKKMPSAKNIYANIIAEYMRLITEKPAITTNNPRQLWEVMHYSYTYYQQGIASEKLCRQLRIHIAKMHKTLNPKDHQLRTQYNNILEKTAGLCKD